MLHSLICRILQDGKFNIFHIQLKRSRVGVQSNVRKLAYQHSIFYKIINFLQAVYDLKIASKRMQGAGCLHTTPRENSNEMEHDVFEYKIP
jgi:hypothetical protein